MWTQHPEWVFSMTNPTLHSLRPTNFFVGFIATEKTHLFLAFSIMNHRPVISSFPSKFCNSRQNPVSRKAVISLLPLCSAFSFYLFPRAWKEPREIIWIKHSRKAFYNLPFLDRWEILSLTYGSLTLRWVCTSIHHPTSIYFCVQNCYRLHYNIIGSENHYNKDREKKQHCITFFLPIK